MRDYPYIAADLRGIWADLAQRNGEVRRRLAAWVLDGLAQPEPDANASLLLRWAVEHSDDRQRAEWRRLVGGGETDEEFADWLQLQSSLEALLDPDEVREPVGIVPGRRRTPSPG